jgi:hypothetical protein
MEVMIVVVALMLGAWAVAGYAIWKWGPGVRRRSVRCPEKGAMASVIAEQREGDFGCLRVVDVKACSLVAGDILTCDRECMARL